MQTSRRSKASTEWSEIASNPSLAARSQAHSPDGRLGCEVQRVPPTGCPSETHHWGHSLVIVEVIEDKPTLTLGNESLAGPVSDTPSVGRWSSKHASHIRGPNLVL